VRIGEEMRRFTKIDLDEIRQEMKPSEGWGTNENWEEMKESRCAERVFGIFAFFEMCQTIGRVEHTNDWDWWITSQTRQALSTISGVDRSSSTSRTRMGQSSTTRSRPQRTGPGT
jgi:hypothetical protein